MVEQGKSKGATSRRGAGGVPPGSPRIPKEVNWAANQRFLQGPALLFLLLQSCTTVSTPQEHFGNADFRHHGEIISVTVNKDRIISFSTDGTIGYWSTASGDNMKKHAGPKGYPTCIAFGRDLIALGAEDGSVRLLDLHTGVERRAFQAHAKPLTAISWAPDDKSLLTSSMDRTVLAWDATGKEIGVVSKHDRDVPATIALTATHAAVLTITGTLTIHEAANWKESFTGAVGRNSLRVDPVLALSPDGRMVSFAGRNGTLALRSTRNGNLLDEVRLDGITATSASFSRDSKHLAIGALDGRIAIWDLQNRTVVRILDRHYGPVRAVAFSSNGGSLASGGADHRVRYWHLSTGEDLSPRGIHDAPANGLGFLSDKELIVSGQDGKLVKWTLNPGKPIAAQVGPLGQLTCTNRRLVAATPTGVTFRDSSLREMLHLETKGLAKLASTPNGMLVVVDDENVRWLDGMNILRTKPLPGSVQAIASSPAGDLLAVSFGLTMKIYDATGEVLSTWNETNEVDAVTFSPCGNILTIEDVTGVRALNPKTKGLLWSLENVTGVTWTPCGQILAVRREDDAALLLINARTRATLRKYERGVGIAHRWTFSPDGRLLAVAQGDTTIDLRNVQELHEITCLGNTCAAINAMQK